MYYNLYFYLENGKNYVNYIREKVHLQSTYNRITS